LAVQKRNHKLHNKKGKNMSEVILNKEDKKRIIEALENYITDIRLYNKKERNRLRNKTTKNLVQRKNDQMIVDKAEEKIVGLIQTKNLIKLY